MDIEVIKSNLCSYDPRNPDLFMDDEDREAFWREIQQNKRQCSCDTCFYGRAALANALLKALNLEQQIIDNRYI